MIIGISGQAGSGKDTIADILVEKYRFVRVGLADPLKRICKDVFDFSDEQLWGPSDFRNAGDLRYPRQVLWCEEEPSFMGHKDSCYRTEHLSPRYALQTLGTEWGRDCYGDVWIGYGLRVAEAIETGKFTYTAKAGLIPLNSDPQRRPSGVRPPTGVVFSDFRFRNEILFGKKKGRVVRVKRPGYTGKVGIAGHPSEEEQKSFLDSEFDYVVENTGTLDDLALEVDRMMNTLTRAVRTAG